MFGNFMNKIPVVRFVLVYFDIVKMELSSYPIKEEIMTTKKVCLNAWRNAHAVVTAVQGEVAARFIEISLYDHDKILDISDKTAAIYMTKPDKTIVYNECEILDAKNGLISVELTSQMSAVAGTICDCEIHVIDKNGSLLKILGLTIIIDRSLEDDKAIESSNEFTLLLKALKETDGLIEKVTEVLNEKLNEFDDTFENLAEQMKTQMTNWLAVKDEEILRKMQTVDDWLDNGDEQLQQVVTDAQNAVQTAVSQANAAADRANQAVDQMEQVAAELVDEAVNKQKNQPNGLAGLDSSGKLQQMPTALDVGAVSVETSVNGKPLAGNITLTAQDVKAIAAAEKNQANGVAGLNESGKLIQMPTASDVGAVSITTSVNGKSLTSNITLTAQDVNAITTTEKNQANGVAGLNESGKLIQMPTAIDVGAVPPSRTINGKALEGNITLTADDIGTSAIFLASHPVGDIYFTTNAANPGTRFGGTWAAWGGGRTPVSVNTADTNFNTVEKTGGEKTHTLTVAETPSHSHRINDIAIYGQGVTGFNFTSTSDGDWKGFYKNTEPTGGGQAHNNLPPYITCYIWKRTT